MTLHDLREPADTVQFTGSYAEDSTRPATVPDTLTVADGDQLLIQGARGTTLRYRVAGAPEPAGDLQVVHLAWLPD